MKSNPDASEARYSQVAISRKDGTDAGPEFAFPNRMRKNRFRNKEYEEKLNNIKWEVCRMLQRVAHRNGWYQYQLASRLGTTQSRISHVFGQKYDKLTFDQLFTYLIIAEPRFKILIAI
jgi:predicted XRE-type DNA-binding protein